MEIVRSTSPAAAAAAAAEALSNLLGQCSDTPVLLLLSGGSWFATLDHVDTSSLGEHCTLSMLDERFSTDPKINNFSQFKETSFYKAADTQHCTFISTNVGLADSMTAVQQQWDDDLKKWRTKNPNGVVIAAIGIGLDGHIAGLFPGIESPHLQVGDWTQSYVLPESVNPYRERITITEYFLMHIVNHSVVFASGPEKQSMITRLSSLEVKESVLPVDVLGIMQSVTIFSDEKF